MNILHSIYDQKQKEVAKQKTLLPIGTLQKSRLYSRNPISLRTRLDNSVSPGIIAEYKRKSPSHGIINKTSPIPEVVTNYTETGVTGISILSDEYFFGGNREDIVMARLYTDLPILRKDFICAEYQIIESKSLGADVILLIAAMLTRTQIHEFTETAKNLGLEILLELHFPEEIEKIDESVDMIGINNRDLRTFSVDTNTAITLKKALSDTYPVVAESGIERAETIKHLYSNGIKGFLIGTYFMASSNPGETCNNFIHAMKNITIRNYNTT